MKIDSGITPPVDSALKNRTSAKADNSAVSNEQTPSTVINLSGNAKKLQEQIKQGDPSDEVRPEAVADAKADIANWKGLSDEQIDTIMSRMFDEMSL